MKRAQLIRTLGIIGQPDADGIGQAFRTWAKTNHPDAGGDADLFARVSVAVKRFTRKQGAIIKGCFVRYQGAFCEVVGVRPPHSLEVVHNRKVVVIPRADAETPVMPVNRANVSIREGYALVPAAEFYGTTKSLKAA